MIHSFEETKVTGIDIVELNPYHDNGATASLAAKNHLHYDCNEFIPKIIFLIIF